jgi:hypothetical protein
VNAIAETSTANPVAATLALGEIKKAAQESNNPDLADLASRRIMTIQRTAPPTLAPLIQAPKDQ